MISSCASATMVRTLGFVYAASYWISRYMGTLYLVDLVKKRIFVKKKIFVIL